MIQTISRFQQPPGNGMAIVDLKQLKDYIKEAYSGINQTEAQQKLLQLQESDDIHIHILHLLESLYNYDTIAAMSPEFNDICFEQLLIYCSILLQNVMTRETLQSNPEVIIQVYMTTIHLVCKWCKIRKLKKHLVACLQRANGFIQAIPAQQQHELFTVLIDFIYQQLQQSTIQTLVPILMVEEGLVHFLFELEQLHTSFTLVIQETFTVVGNLSFLKDGGDDYATSVSQLLVVVAQKYHQFDPTKVLPLLSADPILQFIHGCFELNLSPHVKENVLKVICLVEECRTSQLDIEVNFNYTALMVQLVPTLLVQYSETVSLPYKVLLLETIRLASAMQELYNFFHASCPMIFSTILLTNLQSDEQERANLTENSTDYLNFQKQLISGKKLGNLKSESTLLLQQLATRIDGFASFVFAFALEHLTRLITGSDEFIQKSREHTIQYSNQAFFLLPVEEQIEILMLVVCLLCIQVRNRKDLRKSLEQFIRLHFNELCKYKNSAIRARCILIQKMFLPYMFPKQENLFNHCIRYLFNFLSKSNYKQCKSLRAFALDALMDLVDDSNTNIRLENAIMDNIDDFCKNLEVGDPKPYYKFVSKVLKYHRIVITRSYTYVIDAHLQLILETIAKRIKNAFQSNSEKKDLVRQYRLKAKAGIQILEGLKLFSQILGYKYCLETHLPQIEPALIDLCSIFLDNETYWDFIDELIDVQQIFIAYTKGQSDITYRLFAVLPQMIQKGKIITVSSVFKLYFVMITEASNVLVTKPAWIQIVLQHLLGQINPQLLINVRTDCSDLLKVVILFNALLQVFSELLFQLHCSLILEYIPQILNQMVYLLQELVARHGMKQIISKIIQCIFTPFLYNKGFLDEPSKMILLSTIEPLKQCYSNPQTLYNYRMLFQITSFLIENCSLLWLPQETHEICYQLLTFTLQQVVSYIDKVNFSSKLGGVNFTQQSTKKGNQQGDVQRIQAEEEEDSQERDQFLSKQKIKNTIPSGQNLDDFMLTMMTYKKEKEIEGLVNLNYLPLSGYDLEPVKSSINFIRNNIPIILQALSPESKALINELATTVKVTAGTDDVQFRKVISALKRRNQHLNL